MFDIYLIEKKLIIPPGNAGFIILNYPYK